MQECLGKSAKACRNAVYEVAWEILVDIMLRLEGLAA